MWNHPWSHQHISKQREYGALLYYMCIDRDMYACIHTYNCMYEIQLYWLLFAHKEGQILLKIDNTMMSLSEITHTKATIMFFYSYVENTIQEQNNNKIPWEC